MTAVSRDDLARHMAEALRIAERGRFRVEPNPIVGAVVLDAEGIVVGRGAHVVYGGAHAEIRALAEAGPRAKGGTLVVTLEPCTHTKKKTPPCAPAVAAAGIARVVAGCEDANPATHGQAAAAFAEAGIAYESGVLAEDCRAAIGRYARHLASDRPWTIAKWAMSLDGRIADARGASRWISGEASRRIVHEIRGAVDAIVVGRGTVRADDPRLVADGDGTRSAMRVVFDSSLRTRPTARVVETARDVPTLILAARGADSMRRKALAAAGAQVAEIERGDDGRVDVRAAFRELRARGVRRALVESGGELQAACLRAGVVDQVAAFVAPKIVGGAGPTPFSGQGWGIAEAPRLEWVRVSECGEDALVEGYWPAAE